MINAIFAKPITSRVRVVIGSGISMVATDLASAKLSTMLASAKVASIQATKLVATKVMAKLGAFWLLIMSFAMPIQQPAKIVVQKIAVHHRHHVVAAPVVQEAPMKMLYLHTFEKEYTVVFAGKVTCGNSPCHDAEVQVHITSAKNPNIMKTATIQPDGSYEVSILVKEFLHEHLDWWIVADSPDSASKQIQGREILMEDANIKIEEPIALL